MSKSEGKKTIHKIHDVKEERTESLKEPNKDESYDENGKDENGACIHRFNIVTLDSYTDIQPWPRDTGGLMRTYTGLRGQCCFRCGKVYIDSTDLYFARMKTVIDIIESYDSSPSTLSMCRLLSQLFMIIENQEAIEGYSPTFLPGFAKILQVELRDLDSFKSAHSTDKLNLSEETIRAITRAMSEIVTAVDMNLRRKGVVIEACS